MFVVIVQNNRLNNSKQNYLNLYYYLYYAKIRNQHIKKINLEK